MSCEAVITDFSIINYCETGTEQSRTHIRTWMGHLARFIHTLDLVHARPLPGLLTRQPAYTVESTFGVAGQDMVVYLADERELGEGEGEVIQGEVALDLPPGEYKAACYSPETGLYSPGVPLAGGRGTTVRLPEFRHDLVMRIGRR